MADSAIQNWLGHFGDLCGLGCLLLDSSFPVTFRRTGWLAYEPSRRLGAFCRTLDKLTHDRARLFWEEFRSGGASNHWLVSIDLQLCSVARKQ